jgi:hypothetical protein|tara:strand:- start:380 stop:802 length:423 start_codon:yes stop_codon:yes gene_type:complete
MQLPLELIELILQHIDDNETYRNCRIVSKDWNHILKLLKNYYNGEVISIIKFDFNSIRCIDKTNFTKFEFIHKSVGKDIYKEYNSKGVLLKQVIIEFPKKITCWSLKNNILTTKKIDITTENIDTLVQPLFPLNHNCNIM